MVTPATSLNRRDEDRFMADLAAQFAAPLHRYFRKRGFSADVADDYTQDVLLRMLKLQDRSRIDNPEAYVFRVAAAVIADRARRDGVRASKLHDCTDDVILADEEPSAERVLNSRQQLERLKEVLDEMPARRREILMLSRMDGLSYSQLAARYGVTVSAIEKQMMKAIAHLDKRMGMDRP